MSPWTLARRCARMNASAIRELLKVAEQPGMLSMAGGLPSPDSFPVQAMRQACDKVLTDTPREALQYASTEGFAPLRDWVAQQLRDQGQRVSAEQVLITTGSQQGLDLVGKVLIDAGAPVAVETPTYLGALQAFNPFEPLYAPLHSDEQGPLPQALAALKHDAPGTRFAYLLPNFQNPTGRVFSAARREQLVAAAQCAAVPLVEDNPYGELWFDAPPPPPLAALWPEGVVYLGSFSKVLAPGLRLGYLVAPQALHARLVNAKQAADLHTPSFNQRVVHEVIRNGFFDQHVPKIRQRYRSQCMAMAQALQAHLPEDCVWQQPRGGMFFWLRLPEDCDATALLPAALEQGMAYVPGMAFYPPMAGRGAGPGAAHGADPRTLRLSFVTLAPEQIDTGVAMLGRVLRSHLDSLREPAP